MRGFRLPRLHPPEAIRRTRFIALTPALSGAGEGVGGGWAGAIVVAVILGLPGTSSISAAETRDGVHQPLIVAVADSPPFAIKTADGTWSGLSVELWREIAAQLELRWEPREVELLQVDDLLRDRAVDAALGSIAVTAEGERAHDFSQPYYSTGLSFAERSIRGSSMHVLLDSLSSSGLLRLVLWIAVATLVVGVVIAFIERRHGETEFGGPLGRGIATGVWWAAVTMTTVGYGDATPKTAPGRSLALLWMFVGLVAVALFTATVTSLLTVHSLHGTVQRPADLFHVRLGTVTGSAGAKYLSDRHVTFRPYDDYSAALTGLADHQVDAVVANMAVLHYEVSRSWRGTLQSSPIVLEPVRYAIGISPGSPLREAIDRTLLHIIAQDGWQEVEHQYLGHP
jgi:ABC-type amino acid transport substrate-binding protein